MLFRNKPHLFWPSEQKISRDSGVSKPNISFPRPFSHPWTIKRKLQMHSRTHRLMEVRRRDPDFLFSVVQMSRSLNRNRERSFLPPTVFYSTEKDRGLGSSSFCLNWFDFLCLLVLTVSTTISCLRNFLCGFRIWQENTLLGIAEGKLVFILL